MKTLFIFVLALTTTFSLYAQEEKEVSAKLESATILRAGAELLHTAKPVLTSGNNEIVVEGLSSIIDENSLKIKCSGDVTVMGSEFFKDYLSQKVPTASIKKLQDSIDICTKESKRLDALMETNHALKELLQENKSIKGEQTGLTVSELIKMMDYYKSKSLELETEKNATLEAISKNEERLRALRSQMAQESGKNNKVSGKLRLKLAAPIAGTYDLEVSYYTPSAYWVPFYDIQAASSDKPIKLLCKAKFMQMTGLDWSKVALTLSTATPSNGRTAPIFDAWFLSPVLVPHNGKYYAAPDMEMEEVVVTAAQNSISYKSQKEAAKPVSTGPIYVMNGRVITEAEMKSISPAMIAKVEVLKDAAATSVYGANAANGVVMITLKDSFVSESENEIDLTYTVDLPYNVLSTGSEQTVTLRTLEIPATFEYYCAPKLDKATYLLAGIKDWAKYNLLPGEANITYAGTYAGKSYIDPNSTRDILHLTLGSDKRVVVKREKLQDYTSTKFLGNDKEQQFAYQLTVKNNKNIPVDMILKDQYPISTDKSIVVKVVDVDGAHVNEDVGTLTWEFQLKPGETRTFKMKYSVKYPKDMSLGL